jgi:hypothetical protein
MCKESDERASGLIRLMSVDSRWLILIEFGVRQHLAEQEKKLAGLYARNSE